MMNNVICMREENKGMLRSRSSNDASDFRSYPPQYDVIVAHGVAIEWNAMSVKLVAIGKHTEMNTIWVNSSPSLRLFRFSFYI